MYCVWEIWLFYISDIFTPKKLFPAPLPPPAPNPQILVTNVNKPDLVGHEGKTGN